jgi:CheY-like chemotaxis protein
MSTTLLEQVEILLVEDNAEDADDDAPLRKRLANQLHWADGEEALEYSSAPGSTRTRPARPPKLVLLDIKMPKVTASRCCAASRHRSSRRCRWWS